jgi:hypothetical protein
MPRFEFGRGQLILAAEVITKQNQIGSGFITDRARAVFKLVNAAPAAFEADGKSVRYGLTPMTLEEWVDTQVSPPHLFESNAGGGAAGASALPHGGGGAGTRGVTRNPFKRETWNLTEQMRLLKSDPHWPRG